MMKVLLADGSAAHSTPTAAIVGSTRNSTNRHSAATNGWITSLMKVRTTTGRSARSRWPPSAAPIANSAQGPAALASSRLKLSITDGSSSDASDANRPAPIDITSGLRIKPRDTVAAILRPLCDDCGEPCTSSIAIATVISTKMSQTIVSATVGR